MNEICKFVPLPFWNCAIIWSLFYILWTFIAWIPHLEYFAKTFCVVLLLFFFWWWELNGTTNRITFPLSFYESSSAEKKNLRQVFFARQSDGIFPPNVPRFVGYCAVIFAVVFFRILPTTETAISWLAFLGTAHQIWELRTRAWNGKWLKRRKHYQIVLGNYYCSKFPKAHNIVEFRTSIQKM